ncbi:hypothetical protein KSF_095640 [Reticulibacter mediterranei]|uniref:Uncharacterized protein n=1 Tax=Reticulibacter mediterranei TaxID=2778369 RepID=A0A8J3J2E0_9CHLR|nr:hypothetical protein [Reticulibacter mediterranei]GHO99516.1 hypothetical protein KSF_095640 [Reticulibacter mediterranei]
MNHDEQRAAVEQLIERVDLYRSSEETVECIAPFDDGPFESVGDKEELVGEMVRAMEQLGAIVGEVSFIDGEGNEHPLTLPPRRHPWYAHYILDERGQPVPTYDLHAAVRLEADIKKRTVAKTFLRSRGERIEVSTVFTAFNFALLPNMPPVLWESMIFSRRARLGGTKMRYNSEDAARAGHQWLVKYTQKFLKTGGWQRCRKPTLHQAFAMVQRQRRLQRKRGMC